MWWISRQVALDGFVPVGFDLEPTDEGQEGDHHPTVNEEGIVLLACFLPYVTKSFWRVRSADPVSNSRVDAISQIGVDVANKKCFRLFWPWHCRKKFQRNLISVSVNKPYSCTHARLSYLISLFFSLSHFLSPTLLLISLSLSLSLSF